MSIFSNLFKKKGKKEIKSIEPQIQKEDDDEVTAVITALVPSMNEEEETVVAITAAIACMLGKSTSEFTVRNIKKTFEIDSLWALKGRMKLMR